MIKARPVTLVGAAIVLFLASALGFGWASLGWLQPSASDKSVGVGHPYLILYTNQPDSVNTAQLSLAPDQSGTLSGILQVNFAAIEDEVNFRWALVGGNGMAFSAEMETLNKTSRDTGEPVSRSPKVPPAEGITRSCESGNTTSDTQSVFVGGLNSARLLGTDGVESARIGLFMTQIRLPRVLTVRDGDTYGWNVAVGQPTERDSYQAGMLRYDLLNDCIDLSGVADVQDIAILEATPVQWSVAVSGATLEDAVLRTNPQSTQSGFATWEISDNTRIEALFTDRSRTDRRQSVMFLAGIWSGLASGIIVLGLFQTPSPSGGGWWGSRHGRERSIARSRHR